MLSEKQLKEIKEFCKDELRDYEIYKSLSKIDKKNRKILEEFAKQEYEHYKFWQKFLKEKVHYKLNIFYHFFLILIKKIFGITFLIKFLERHETETIKKYEEFLKYLEGEDKEKLKEIIKQEKSHEEKLIKMLKDENLKYINFSVLGTTDAIIEVTGVHAGFLGLTTSTLIAGLAGLIVGFSASISMGAAAYMQSKYSRDKSISPWKAGIFTGISYLISVILLAIPYFLSKDMIVAFASSIVIASMLILIFSFISSVLEKKSLAREFMENILLIMLVSFASFMFGEFLAKTFGIEGIFTR